MAQFNLSHVNLDSQVKPHAADAAAHATKRPIPIKKGEGVCLKPKPLTVPIANG